MLKNIISIVVLFSVFNFCLGQTTKQINKVSYYKDTIKSFTKITGSVEKEDTYKDFVFKDKKTNKEIKMKDLDNFNKKLFMLIQFEHLSSIYGSLLKDLSEALETFDETVPSDKAANDNEVAQKGDIEDFIKQLKDDKKIFLDKYKIFVEDFFNSYELVFTKKEVQDYLLKIKLAKEELK